VLHLALDLAGHMPMPKRKEMIIQAAITPHIERASAKQGHAVALYIFREISLYQVRAAQLLENEAGAGLAVLTSLYLLAELLRRCRKAQKGIIY